MAEPAPKVCENGHDFTDPVVVRLGAHLLHASAELAVSICRRCGACAWQGWVFEDE